MISLFDRARWRLTAFFTGVLAIILVLVGLAVFATARAALFDGVNDDLRARATRQVLQPFRRGPAGDARGIIEAITAGGYFYAVVTPAGETVATRNTDLEALAPADDLTSLAPGDERFIDTKNAEGEDFRVYVTRLAADGPVLQVGRSTEPERRALRRLVVILLAGGAGGLALAVGGGYWLAGRALQPIKTSMDRQRQFVADASHELRTPLSLIRANAELLKREAQAPVAQNIESVDDIIRETDRLTVLVGQMLTLARSDAGEAALEREPVDLAALARQRVREMTKLAEQAGVTLTAEAAGCAIVEGDETRLRELITILLDNAIKYSGRGAGVAVSVENRDGRARLRVSDTGPGIPRAALDRVFERFYRVDRARSREAGGSGLGLSIAKWIADAHGGVIKIESAEGRGTTVTVELPLAPER